MLRVCQPPISIGGDATSEAPPLQLHHYCTAQHTPYRLTKLPVPPLDPAGGDMASVFVDPTVRYQEIEGFGGAFTEAAALTFYKLPIESQREILVAYFDPVHGHGYTLGRTHINSCDFSLGNYAYDEVDGDATLAHFSIDRDRQALIPMIKAAMEIWCNGTPSSAMPPRVSASVSGMAMATTSAVRQSIRNRQTSTTTNTASLKQVMN